LAANLNVYLHCLMLDGMNRGGGDGVPAIVELAAPTDDELHALLQTRITWLMKLLTRRSVLVVDMGQTCEAEPSAEAAKARTLRLLQAAAVTYCIAFGSRAGQEVLTRKKQLTQIQDK
jgi:hypothetical protein